MQVNMYLESQIQ